MSASESKEEIEDSIQISSYTSVFSNEKAGAVEEDSGSVCDSKKDTESESNCNLSSQRNSAAFALNEDDTVVAGSHTFFCQVCFSNNDESVAFKLPCQHQFCKDCLVSYVKSKVTDGRVYPTCFFIDESGKDEGGGEVLGVAPGSTERAVQKYKACGAEIPPHIMESLLTNDEMLEKYNRYKFVKENSNARECPHCCTWNITPPEKLAQPDGARVTCGNSGCQRVYCYYHANAHDFEVYPTCAEYEAAIAPQMKANQDFLNASSKPCPGCHIHVMKSGGCNHMKCQCGAAFCWLCGKQIDDSLFPAHFQWWNPSGCSNLQMNESIEPTTCARIFARVLSLVQLVVLGPLTLLSTLTSSLLCCSCIVVKLQMQRPLSLAYVQTFFGNCMSSWGLFWMFLLCFVPLAIVGGSVFVTAVFVAGVISYPCYAAHRIRKNQYPWPDQVTRFTHLRLVCLRRCCGCREGLGHGGDQLPTCDPAAAEADGDSSVMDTDGVIEYADNATGAGIEEGSAARVEDIDAMVRGEAGEGDDEQPQDLGLCDVGDIEQGSDSGGEAPTGGATQQAYEKVASGPAHQEHPYLDLEGGGVAKGRCKRDTGGNQMPSQQQQAAIAAAVGRDGIKSGRKPSVA